MNPKLKMQIRFLSFNKEILNKGSMPEIQFENVFDVEFESHNR